MLGRRASEGKSPLRPDLANGSLEIRHFLGYFVVMRTSKSSRGSVVGLAVLLAVTAASSSQAQALLTPAPYIVAQSDYGGENGNFGGVTAGYPFTQTFTPTRDGTLYSLSGGFYAPQTGMQPYYIFQFRDTTTGGAPSTHVIASVDVPTDPLTAPDYAWIDLTADFSSFGIALMAGHKYAFSIDVPGPFGSTTFNNFFWGLTGSGYAGGDIYYIPPSGPVLLDSASDFLFTVQAVPEPPTIPLALFGAGLLGLFFGRNRFWRPV